MEEGNKFSRTTASSDLLDSRYRMRLYQQWPGRNYFCCCGHVMTGSNPGCFITSQMMIVVPCILFAQFVLIHFPWYHHVASGTVAVFALVNMYRAALSDPGIVPRRPQNLPAPAMPTQRDVDGKPLRYCLTCNLYRPPRCKHCKFCDNCVLEFDHHCPWVGTCIGRRNYRYFLRFIFSLTVLCGYVLTLGTLFLCTDGASSFYKVIQKNPVTFGLCVYTLLMFFSLFFLTVYHTNLVRKATTTNEAIRKVFEVFDGKSPFDQGCFRNIKRICWNPLPRSHLQLRAWLYLSDSSFSEDQDILSQVGNPFGLASRSKSVASAFSWNNAVLNSSRGGRDVVHRTSQQPQSGFRQGPSSSGLPSTPNPNTPTRILNASAAVHAAAKDEAGCTATATYSPNQVYAPTTSSWRSSISVDDRYEIPTEDGSVQSSVKSAQSEYLLGGDHALEAS